MVAHHGLPFAEQLKRYRRDRGLTQEELAEQAGLSARGIRALEQGERSSPHKDTVRLLADALGLSPDRRAQFEHASIAARSGAVQREPSPPIGAFLGAVPSGQIIAREDEVGRLLRMMDDVARATGRTVLIAGEPGIGKTRLAQEVAVAARSRGFLVASGRCYEPEQSVPYYPFNRHADDRISCCSRVCAGRHSTALVLPLLASSRSRPCCKYERDGRD